MRKTGAVWHPPWTEVDTLGPARPTLTSLLVSVLGVSGVWGLGKVEGEGGGNQRLQATGCKLSVQFATACFTLERLPPTLQSAGCPRDASAVPHGLCGSAPGSLAPSLPPRAGVPGGGAPMWLSFLELRDRGTFPGRPGPGSPSQVLPSLGDAGGVQPVPWLLQQAPPEAAGKAAGLGQQTPYPPLV